MTLTIGQAPANLRSYKAPEIDTALNTQTVEKLKTIQALNLGEFVTRTDFDLQTQVGFIKEIECRQDNTYSVRAHRLQSLAYAAGTIFFVVVAGMTPKFSYGMTKTYRVASAIITGLVLLANSTKAYADTKKWCKENAVDNKFYWIPVYNEIRYLCAAFLAKSGLGKVHENLINELNGNLELCKTIDDNWDVVESELKEQKEIDAVSNVIKFAQSLAQFAKEEAEKIKEV